MQLTPYIVVTIIKLCNLCYDLYASKFVFG